ncbi:MAG: FAD:protein FMN transferase [Thermodesulfobacteriota bacterium]
MNSRLKKSLSYLTVTLIVFLLLYATLNTKAPMEYSFARMQMGTVVEITVYGGEEEGIDRAVEAAFREIDRLEAIFSSYRDDSDVSRINQSAGKGKVVVSPEVIFVATRALEIAKVSGGAFDPTVGILGQLWSFSGEKERAIPSREAVEELLKFVDYRQVVIDRDDSAISLGKEGMALNLGGVAKGYIVGRAVEVLKGGGITRGIVKAGGDMVVFDRDKRQRPFKIGIQHPRREGVLAGEISFTNEAIATSGDYERFVIRDGVRYHHILDPLTGFPARGTQGVTILSREPTLADALSTTVFVLGPEKGMALIESMSGVEGMIIDEAGEITASSGLKGRLVLKERAIPSTE